MTTPIVSDLELLAEISLKDVSLGHINNVAYYSGVIAGLCIAEKYIEVGVENPDPEFWGLLSGDEKTTGPLPKFLSKLKLYASPKFVIDVNNIPEQGLRHGEPGKFYTKGIMDAVNVAIKQVPFLFQYTRGAKWKSYTSNWINEKLALADVNLEVEKHLNLRKK